jgi:hypothetical protein
VFDEQPVWQPVFANTDWAQLVRVGDSQWSADRGPGRGTTTPIMALNYADGTHAGLGYMEVWFREPQPVSGERKVREVFTVGSQAFSAASVAVRLKRVVGTSPLVARLENARGTVLATGHVPAAQFAVARRSGPEGSSWATIEFDEPVSLDAHETYRLVLSTRRDTEYLAIAIREGASYGFHPATYFSNGMAEWTDGSGWKPFVGWGRPSHEADLQFYLRAAQGPSSRPAEDSE